MIEICELTHLLAVLALISDNIKKVTLKYGKTNFNKRTDKLVFIIIIFV